MGPSYKNHQATKISIVDDDESMREAIKTLIASLGMDVEEFPSAESFLESGSCNSSNCLILDVRMPGLTGPELQRRLLASNKRIPIIFVTAHYTEEGRAKAMAAGAVAFLAKPFNEDELLQALELSQSTDPRAERTINPTKFSNLRLEEGS